MLEQFIHNLVYKFHRLGFYVSSVKFYYEDHRHKENFIVCFIKALVLESKIFNYKHGYYEYLEIPLTTVCSLRCKHCSNLIPCYKKPHDYDIDIILKSISTFLKCISNIVYIRLLGGEPFLSKNLYRVVRFLLKSKKIQRIEVVTNGTIIPHDEKLISILKSPRVIVCISQYPIVDYNKLVSFLKKNDIRYRIDKMSYWMDYGNVKKRNRTEKELKRQFSRCHSVCKSLVNGEVHICPRSSHGTDLGIIKGNESDYLDLLDDGVSISRKRKMLHNLFKKKYIMACNYCDYGTKFSKRVKVAEQISYKKMD